MSSIPSALGPAKAYVGLETVPCLPSVKHVILTSDEVTAICPVTSQPDWYTVSISYWPNGVIIESKSLKLFLSEFRDTGIFCEDLAATVGTAVQHALGADCAITVKVVQKSRGGITIEAEAHA